MSQNFEDGEIDKKNYESLKNFRNWSDFHGFEWNFIHFCRFFQKKGTSRTASALMTLRTCTRTPTLRSVEEKKIFSGRKSIIFLSKPWKSPVLPLFFQNLIKNLVDFANLEFHFVLGEDPSFTKKEKKTVTITRKGNKIFDGAKTYHRHRKISKEERKNTVAQKIQSARKAMLAGVGEEEEEEEE